MITDDTQPSYAIGGENELLPPPRFLFYGVIGFSLLSVVLPVLGIIIFRNTLRPSQQQRIINSLSFMVNFLPYRPAVDDTLPTAIYVESTLSTDDLLVAVVQTPIPTPHVIPIPVVDIDEQALPSVTAIPTLYVSEQALPTSTATSRVSDIPPTQLSTIGPSSARLYGFTFEQQTWNNCGPASVTIALSYFGWKEDQEYARRILRPDREDKNVTPDEMVDFVNQNTGIRALWRYGGTIDLLRELIANEFPVIIGTGFMPEAYDWIGHYRTVVAYDSAYFYFYDSFMGTGSDSQGYALPVDEVDQNWQHFNRRFIVFYGSEREEQLRALLNDWSTSSRANELALETAQQEARIDPTNGYAWFNMGTSLAMLSRFQEAAIAFDRARQAKLPWRMLWYQFEPYRAYYEIGRFDDVLALVQSNLNNGGKYVEETFYWQGMVFEAQDQLDKARGAFQQALQLNPNFSQGNDAINRINSMN